MQVLDACSSNAVPALVYVSTYNVVFNGQVRDLPDDIVAISHISTRYLLIFRKLSTVTTPSHLSLMLRTSMHILGACASPIPSLCQDQVSCRATRSSCAWQFLAHHRRSACWHLWRRGDTTFSQNCQGHQPRYRRSPHLAIIIIVGMGFFAIGAPTALCDWVYGEENLGPMY